jgi:hypothetical protein
MAAYTFEALIRKERWFVAECPELGIAAHGRSFGEALAALRIATVDDLTTLCALDRSLVAARAASAPACMGGVVARRYVVELTETTEEGTIDSTTL